MKFGVHISTAKPFSDAPARAKSTGCDCMQIFANPPQRWNPIPIADSEIERFKVENEKAQISPIIIHSIYLVNLASDNPFFYEASKKSLIDDMNKAAALGAIGANFHVGSTKGKSFSEVIDKIDTAIREILAATPENTFLIIENSAGAGNIIGDTLEEIGEIIKMVKSPRLKVLIDTAHAFESGYDLRTAHGGELFIDQFDSLIGLDRLVGFHLNDSKTDFNSKRDRHADIGAGFLGKDAFKFIINHPKLRDLFGILETPTDTMTYEDQLKLLRKMEDEK